jgi:hypothetical protein
MYDLGAGQLSQGVEEGAFLPGLGGRPFLRPRPAALLRGAGAPLHPHLHNSITYFHTKTHRISVCCVCYQEINSCIRDYRTK